MKCYGAGSRVAVRRSSYYPSMAVAVFEQSLSSCYKAFFAFGLKPLGTKDCRGGHLIEQSGTRGLVCRDFAARISEKYELIEIGRAQALSARLVKYKISPEIHH